MVFSTTNYLYPMLMFSSCYLSKMVPILFAFRELCTKQNWHLLLSEHTLLKLAWDTLASVDLRG